jgi:hypothetical protein
MKNNIFHGKNWLKSIFLESKNDQKDYISCQKVPKKHRFFYKK